MNSLTRLGFAVLWFGLTIGPLSAQPPDGPRRPDRGPQGRSVGREAPGPERARAWMEMARQTSLFGHIDADQDGMLSTEEIKKAPEAIAALDLNKDGNVTMVEVHRVGMEMHGRRHAAGPGPGWGDNPARRGPPRGEGDEPGPPPEFGDRPRRPGREGGFPPRGPGGPGGLGGFGGPGGGPDPDRMMEYLLTQDEDGDGRLSREEWPERMLRMFDRADADGDGSVSEEELEQVRERIRARMGERGGRPFPPEGRPRGGRPPRPQSEESDESDESEA